MWRLFLNIIFESFIYFSTFPVSTVLHSLLFWFDKFRLEYSFPFNLVGLDTLLDIDFSLNGAADAGLEALSLVWVEPGLEGGGGGGELGLHGEGGDLGRYLAGAEFRWIGLSLILKKSRIYYWL